MSVNDSEQQVPPEGRPGTPDPLVGSVLKDTYRVVRMVGEGGMGRVYEAEHVRLRRRVAIKVLLAQYSRHAEVLARFQQEAEIIGSLGHPHIVQVIDVDKTDDGAQFLVMEFLEGETLADRLEREPRLPLFEALRIAGQVASALAGTHEKGIVHRDLKPENVFLVHIAGEKDFVKVLDFGISKVRSGGPKLTAQNVVIGTPAYMAPEQARADRDVDSRADQFALAAMTYEMLAGHSPFPGDDPMEVMHKVVFGRAQPLGEVAPWVPDAVVHVIMRALSVLPDDRYPGVLDLSRALDAAVRAATASTTLRPDEREKSEKATVPRLTPDDRVTVPRLRQAAPVAASEKATEPRPKSDATVPRPSPPVSRHRPSSRPPPHPEIADSVRTPPPPPAEHRVELAAGPRRAHESVRAPSDPRAESSQPPKSAGHPGSARPHEGVGRVESVRASAPAPSQGAGEPRPSTPAPSASAGGRGNVAHAEKLFQDAKAAFADGRIDEAVGWAERLMELGVFGRDAAVFAVLRSAMPLLDRVFEARVGPAERRLSVTEQGRRRQQLNLSSKAEQMLRSVEQHGTVRGVFDDCDIPHRDAVRMLAGLMRRGLVE